MLFYENKTAVNFTSAKTTLNSVFSLSSVGVMTDVETYNAEGYNSTQAITLSFLNEASSGGGLSLPAGTMIVGIWKE